MNATVESRPSYVVLGARSDAISTSIAATISQAITAGSQILREMEVLPILRSLRLKDTGSDTVSVSSSESGASSTLAPLLSDTRPGHHGTSFGGQSLQGRNYVLL